jgi:DNA-binding MarR family transcriptional regulator
LNYYQPPSIIKTESWLMRRSELSVGVKLVYFALKSHYDYDAQQARATQRQLAECLGMTDRHVRAALGQLRALGLIQRVQAPAGAKTVSYVFLRHPWQTLAPRPVERTTLGTTGINGEGRSATA